MFACRRSLGLLLVGLGTALPFRGAPVEIGRAEGRISLASEHLVAEFATTASGGLVALRTRTEARNMLVSPGEWFGASFWVPEAGGAREFQVWGRQAKEFRCQVRREGDEAVVEAEAAGFPETKGIDLSGVRLHAAVRLGPDDKALRWRFAADVPTHLSLQRFEGPRIQLALPFGDAGEDDAVVIGQPKGGVAPQPQAWKKGTRLGGVMSAQFGCAYDAPGGMMTMACDGDGYEKWLYAVRSSEGLLMYWQQAVTGSGRVDVPYDTLVGPFSGEQGRPTDWRDAADIYRAWAETQRWCKQSFAERTDVPDWMKTGPTHVRFGREWLAEPELIEQWFERYWDPHFEGMPLAVTFWGWEKHGSWVAPDYFPPYPSAEGFARAVAAVRKRHGHVFLWPSGYHWTVSYSQQADGTFAWDDRERFAAEGTPHVSLDANGRPRVGKRSWLRGGRNASMCPGDPWTQKWFDDVARGCLDIGADMVQVDQVVRGAFPDCFSDKHGHAPGGGIWKTQATERQLRGLLALGKARTTDFVLGVEEPQEWFNHLVGIQDYRDFQIAGRNGRVPGHLPASVYGYVYHDYLPVFQSNPIRDDPVCQAYCLATGQIPHLVPARRVCYSSLVLNGGFDEWLGDVPRHWQKVSGWQGKVWNGSCARAAEGDGSCLLLSNGDGETVQVSQNVPVSRGGLVAGKEYRLTVRVKTEGVQPGNHLNFGALAPGLKGLGGWPIDLPADTGGKWQQKSVTFTVPEGSTMLRMMLHVNGKGKVWVDDLAVTPADGKAPEVFVPGDHEIMVQWSRLYHGEGRRWLFLGKMLHPPKLDCTSIPYGKIRLPAVFHNAFRAPDGSEAIILANATAAVQPVTLHDGDPQELSLGPFEVRLLKR